jgi:hypothetical protein
MCFSPEADLVGGAFISVVGIDVLRHTGRRRDYFLLAAIPLILGLHQLDETLVWWGLQGRVSSQLGVVATWVYLLIAFVLLPTYLPVAVFKIEPPGPRRRSIGVFVAIGIVVSALLLAAMLRGPVTAELGSYHLGYGTGLRAGIWVVGAYILATCGSLLFSGVRNLALFGIVNLMAVVLIAILASNGFASLWCGWAALASAAFAVHFRLAGPGSARILAA